MSVKSTTKPSQTDWARIAALRDRDIKLTREHPEADPAHIVRGIVRMGLKPMPPKQSISLRVDADVLDWFRARGTGWQTRMNAVLKAYKNAASEASGLPVRSGGSRARRR